MRVIANKNFPQEVKRTVPTPLSKNQQKWKFDVIHESKKIELKTSENENNCHLFFWIKIRKMAADFGGHFGLAV